MYAILQSTSVQASKYKRQSVEKMWFFYFTCIEGNHLIWNADAVKSIINKYKVFIVLILNKNKDELRATQ